MPQFPIPDMGTLTSMADMMRRNRAQRSGAADAASIGQQMQSNLGRQAAIESDYAQRQDEINARATAYDVRGRERSEDFAHTELMQQRSIDAAREMEYSKQAFKLQGAGARVGSAPLRPGGVAPGIAPRTYTQEGGPRSGEQRFITSGGGGGGGSRFPQVPSSDPRHQIFFNTLLQSGEIDEANEFYQKVMQSTDPVQQIESLMGLKARFHERRQAIMNKLTDLDISDEDREMLKGQLGNVTSDLNDLDSMHAAADKRMKAVANPDRKLKATWIGEVEPDEIEKAEAAVQHNRRAQGLDPLPDGGPELTYMVMNELRNMGYSNISGMMRYTPAAMPAVPAAPGTGASHEDEPKQVDSAAAAQVETRRAQIAQRPSEYDESLAGMHQAAREGVSPSLIAARHPIIAARETGAAIGRMTEPARFAARVGKDMAEYYGTGMMRNAAIEAQKYTSLRYLFTGK